MKKKRFTKQLICAAVSAMLLLGDHTGGVVLAAQEDTQPPQTQTTQPPAETAQTTQAPTSTAPEASAGQTKPAQSAEPSTQAEPVPPVEPSTQAEPVPPAVQTELTEDELAAYFRDSVFIGDSIMLGFRNYSAKQKSYVHGIQFLAVGSYSALNAMKPVAGSNVHPMYKGKKVQVWNAIPSIGSKRAFILLGMNDLSPLGLEGARDKYKELINKIVETSPDIEIHIISVTYTLKDQGKAKLNNRNIAKYNLLLQEMAEENDWGYIDLCTPLSDGAGNLAGKYCSDGFVHLSTSAYTVWETELVAYAREQAVKKAAESTPETALDPAAQAAPEAAVQPTVDPAVQPAPEAAVQPTVDPAAQAAPEAAAQPTVDPAAQAAPEAAVQPTVDPAAQAVPEAAAQPTPDAVAHP